MLFRSRFRFQECVFFLLREQVIPIVYRLAPNAYLQNVTEGLTA